MPAETPTPQDQAPHYQSPDWFTWFSPVRLAAFKGNTQLKAGHLPQARETLAGALQAASSSPRRHALSHRH